MLHERKYFALFPFLHIYIIYSWGSENDRWVNVTEEGLCPFPTSWCAKIICFLYNCQNQVCGPVEFMLRFCSNWDAVDLWFASLCLRYSCWLWDAWHTLTVKTDCEEVVVCSERNKTEQLSSLQSHFILCSLLAAIFLFMLNQWYCGGPTCYTSEKQKNTHAQTYFVRWRHWQYVHKILASQAHTRARTHTPISKIKEK